MWYRVFLPTRTPTTPSTLVERLHSQGLLVVPHFKGDDLGWTSGELHLPIGGAPILLARYLTTEDSLRPDLNAYAAELETMTYAPEAAPLMERVIQTQQLLTIRKPIDTPNDSLTEQLCLEITRFTASEGSGFYQIDGQGWFAADGRILVQEY